MSRKDQELAAKHIGAAIIQTFLSPFCIIIFFFAVISAAAAYCWRIDIEKIYRVFYILYLPFLPIVASTITKHPNRAYGGLIAFIIVFFYLNSPECWNDQVKGGPL